MEKCQFSVLTIPNDSSYAKTASSYAGAVARVFGFDEQACRDIAAGVALAVSFVIRQAFDSGQRASLDIGCERISMGLKVVVRDKGLPLDRTDYAFSDEHQKKPCDRIPSSQEPEGEWDEVVFRNLGPEGKELHLVKYLQNPAIDYQFLCEPSSSPHRPARVTERIEFEVRPMLPSEAVEVARLFYRAYGYSFVFRQIYFPDRIVELNETGRISSAVAVTETGEIIGHCALVNWEENSRAAELGFAVVKPEFRGLGCLNKLTEHLVQRAERDGSEALFVLAATNHVYSQRVAHRFGLTACALLAGLGPATVSFKDLTDVLPQRETYLIYFRYLMKPESVAVYVPDHHRRFIGDLYRNMGVEPRFEIPSEHETTFSPECKISTMYFLHTRVAFLEIEEFGANVVGEIKATLKDLRMKRIETIQLYCDMTNPLTYHLTGDVEKLGFFVCGIKPLSTNGEALIFQYLNNICLDFDRIKTATPEGAYLRSYVRAHDSNQITAGCDR